MKVLSPIIDDEDIVNKKYVDDKMVEVDTTFNRTPSLLWSDFAEIPSNVDLNDYTTAGKYIVLWASVATAITNTPVINTGYYLYVHERSAISVYQEAITWGGVSYIRYMSSGTWSNWEQVATTSSNVASATKLETARTINDIAFDGTANITDRTLVSGTIATAGGTAGYNLPANRTKCVVWVASSSGVYCGMCTVTGLSSTMTVWGSPLYNYSGTTIILAVSTNGRITITSDIANVRYTMLYLP